jgi:Tol biopolymer transport system component
MLPAEVSAQYFGRNKVQYRDFDFRVLETQRFDVFYYPEEEAAARLAARMAERWYDRFSAVLGHTLTGRQPLILYASHPEFAQTNIIPGEIGEGTGGVTESLKRRIVLPMQGAVRETDHVIGHELVHAFQYDLGGISPNRPYVGAPALSGLPLWVIEGLAEYLSIGPRSPLTAMWMRDGVRYDRLPSIGDLSNPYEYFPYRWGHSLWAFIGGQYGDRAVWSLFRTAAARGNIEVAIDSVLRIHPDTLARQWHAALVAQYQTLETGAADPGDVATLLTSPDDRDIALGPALSPDGTRIIYLSSRDPYSIDLYLADATTGEVLSRLTESALDPHYENLQFVNSAGAWSRDNERIALAVNEGGHPSLVLMHAGSGERLRTFELPQFGAIYGPTWSPDSRRIAFTANQGGFLDLWMVELETGELTRITEDQYAELHPAWSPDGESIAVSTDRFGEGYAIALLDPETGAATEVPTFQGATSINPQWLPDARSLYVVSNPDGIPDVYRVNLSGGRPARITSLVSGVSGLTELSPALAVSAGTGDIAFAAFEKGTQRIYRLGQGAPIAFGVPNMDAALLPPVNRRDAGVAAFHERPAALPTPAAFQTRGYSAAMKLDYVAPPTLGFSFGGYGTFVAGGIAFGFSDMLARHELGLQLSAEVLGGQVLNGLGGVATYINHANRLNWGVTAGQAPLISQALGQFLVDLDDDGVEELVQETSTFWNVSRHAFALLQYPFSTSTRLELSGGFQRVSFDAETEVRVFDIRTGQVISESDTPAPVCGDSLSLQQRFCRPGSMSLFQGAAALVHDRSLMGPTGPIGGTRYRLEVSPTFGTVNFMGVLGDWRGYWRMASPLTLGVRAMHYGRYLDGAEDHRLQRLFLGYQSLIRGYDNGSFSVGRCPPMATGNNCSEIRVYQELFGSKIAVANAELRLSLFGPVGVIGSRILPLDLVGFFDAGLAWSANQSETPLTDERAWFLGGDREPLTSVGVGLRFNLLGFAIAEVDWVRPFQRPLRSGYITFGFNTAF